MASITSKKYPYVKAMVQVSSYEQVALSYIDTGFDGYIVIPKTHEERLGESDYVSRWELADGSYSVASEYLGKVSIPGLEKEIAARVTCLGDEFLRGRGIVDEFKVTFDHGEKIHIHTSH